MIIMGSCAESDIRQILYKYYQNIAIDFRVIVCENAELVQADGDSSHERQLQIRQ
jgi:hypothetical protein